MPADEHEYQQQLDELRDAASRAMGHTQRGHRLARRTHTSASQPDTEQAHWQLEAVIPFTGVLQTMEW